MQVCIYGRVLIRREREAFDGNLALSIGVNVMRRLGASETFFWEDTYMYFLVRMSEYYHHRCHVL